MHNFFKIQSNPEPIKMLGVSHSDPTVMRSEMREGSAHSTCNLKLFHTAFNERTTRVRAELRKWPHLVTTSGRSLDER